MAFPPLPNLPFTSPAASTPGLSGGVSFITSYLQSQQTQLQQTIFSADKRSAQSSEAQLNANNGNRVAGATTQSLSSNPISNIGGDTINQAVTNVTQQLITTASSKLESAVNGLVGIPLRQTLTSAMNSYFSIVGLISTASTDFALAIARLNGNSILSLVGQKQAVIQQIRPLIRTLQNLVAIIENGTPFFSQYYANMISAYNDISQADTNFKNIVNRLSAFNTYDQKLYQRSVTLLQNAESLLLPAPDANIGAAFGAADISKTLGRQTNKQALAAALAIPGITFQISKLYLQYVELTVEINALLVLYVQVLNNFIGGFQQNQNINQNTINHINAGTAQIDSLLNDMKVLLFPSSAAPIAFQNGVVNSITTTNGTTLIAVTYSNGSSYVFSTTLTPVITAGASFQQGQQLAQDQRFASPVFQGKITSSATAWGIRLATIIQWMQVEPGLASNALSLTSQQVQLYENSVLALQNQGNIHAGQITLTVNPPSQESVVNTTELFGLLLFNANTVIATQQSPANALTTVNQLNSILNAATILDNNIVLALTPFCKSNLTPLTAADGVLGQVLNFTKSAGFDRAADLLSKGDMHNFFNMTGQTATYAGLGAAGCAAILGVLSSNPNTSQRDTATLENVQASYNTQAASKQVEATRSASDSSDVYVAQQQQNYNLLDQQGQQAISVANNQDPTLTTQDPNQQAEFTLGAATGNQFNTTAYPGTPSL